jgi:hypothetical protein
LPSGSAQVVVVVVVVVVVALSIPTKRGAVWPAQPPVAVVMKSTS